MSMTPTQFELLEAIADLERGDEVKSLFQVAAVVLMDYSWGWRVLNRLEVDGLVTVERNGAGVPLKIATTEKGKKAIHERRATEQTSFLEAI